MRSGNRAAVGLQQQSTAAGWPGAINLPNLNLPPQNPLDLIAAFYPHSMVPFS